MENTDCISRDIIFYDLQQYLVTIYSDYVWITIYTNMAVQMVHIAKRM